MAIVFVVISDYVKVLINDYGKYGGGDMLRLWRCLLLVLCLFIFGRPLSAQTLIYKFSGDIAGIGVRNNLGDPLGLVGNRLTATFVVDTSAVASSTSTLPIFSPGATFYLGSSSFTSPVLSSPLQGTGEMEVVFEGGFDTLEIRLGFGTSVIGFEMLFPFSDPFNSGELPLTIPPLSSGIVRAFLFDSTGPGLPPVDEYTITNISVSVEAAAAPLRSVDDAIFGVGSITRDTVTGLDWLDLDVTLNRSFSDVNAQLGIGGQFEGFHHATSADVFQFFTDAGIPIIVTDPFTTFLSPTNIPSVPNLMILWGITDSLNPFVSRSVGVIGDIGPAPGVKFVASLDTLLSGTDAGASTRGSSVGDGSPLPFVGHALVRSTPPEDATELLIDAVETLAEAEVLTTNQADGLVDKLEAIIDGLSRGRTVAVCGQLGAFINQVNAFIRQGLLSPEEGTNLLAPATRIRGQVGCR